jgi:D-alanine transaminase
MRVEERAFTVEEAKMANEAFITSAMNLVTPVISIDDVRIGGGKPGPIAARLRQAYVDHCSGFA